MVVSKENIQKISKGDETAFKSVFDLFYPRLVGFAMNYVDDIMVAEDIVSEIFKNIWEKRTTLSLSGSFSSFLYTSVRNGILNYKRNLSVQLNYKDKIFKENKDLPFYSDMIKEEVHYKLYNALANLPERRRKIFELSVLYNIKDKEIAEDLGISINTIKTQKKRALKDLRQKLKDLFLTLFF